jgi:voltage-gated potassium channel
MANVILRPYVDQFIENILGGAEQDHVFDEAKIFEGSDLDGKTLAESKIRQKYFVVIVGIIPAGSEQLIFNPESNHRLQAGDSLIVLGNVDRIKKLRTQGCEDDRSLSERVSEYDFIQKIGRDSSIFESQV